MEIGEPKKFHENVPQPEILPLKQPVEEPEKGPQIEQPVPGVEEPATR
jgi:hypothetical protein